MEYIIWAVIIAAILAKPLHYWLMRNSATYSRIEVSRIEKRHGLPPGTSQKLADAIVMGDYETTAEFGLTREETDELYDSGRWR